MLSAATGATGERTAAGAVASRVVELNQALNQFRQSAQNAGSGAGDGLSVHLVSHVAAHGPIRAGELAETTRADPSTVSRQVATLVSRGLLERLADPLDGRASLLRTTEAGTSFLQRHIDSRDARFEALLADWSQADRRQFADLLGRFIDDFGRYRDTALAAMNAVAAVPSPTTSELKEATA